MKNVILSTTLLYSSIICLLVLIHRVAFCSMELLFFNLSPLASTLVAALVLCGLKGAVIPFQTPRTPAPIFSLTFGKIPVKVPKPAPNKIPGTPPTAAPAAAPVAIPAKAPKPRFCFLVFLLDISLIEPKPVSVTASASITGEIRPNTRPAASGVIFAPILVAIGSTEDKSLEPTDAPFEIILDSAFNPLEKRTEPFASPSDAKLAPLETILEPPRLIIPFKPVAPLDSSSEPLVANSVPLETKPANLEAPSAPLAAASPPVNNPLIADKPLAGKRTKPFKDSA